MRFLFSIILLIFCTVHSYAQAIITNENIFNYYLIEAVKAKYHNDYNQALSLYMNCYKLDNKSSLAMFEISRIYYGAKKMDEANLWLDRAIEMDSTNNLEYIKYAATLKLFSGKYSQAKDYYKILVNRESDVPTHKLMLARLYSQLQKPDSAHIMLDKISTEQIPWSSIQLEHADLYMHELNPRKLKKTLKAILKREPNEASSYKHIADYHFAIKEPQKALDYLKIGLSKNNGDALLIDFCDYYYKNDDYASFKQYLDRMVASYDITPEIKQAKLSSYLKQQGKESFLRKDSDYFTGVLKKAVALHPDDEPLSLLLTSYHNLLSRQDEAIALMDDFYSSHSVGYDFYTIYISTFFSIKNQDWDRFNVVTKSAYESFPTQPYIVQARVLALNHFNRFSQSIDLLSEYLAEFSDVQSSPQLKALKVDFLNLLAESYYQDSRCDDSFATYDLILSLDPNNILALNNYAYYLSLKEKNLDRAESMSAKTISAEPNNPTYLDTYAWVLFKRGKASMAQLMMEAAMNNSNAPSPDLYEHYGLILHSLGDFDKAKEQFNKALELDPSRDYLSKYLINEK